MQFYKQLYLSVSQSLFTMFLLFDFHEIYT